MRVDLVLAPNPGLFTGPGTNTWVVESDGEAIVVDPGPRIPSHLAAIHAALDGLDPVAVLVTHGHPDHAPAANELAGRLGVPAIGPRPAPGFTPDRGIAAGDSVGFGSAEAVCIGTPGHTADSVSYRVHDLLFTGDHIMGGSTVVIEDMTRYLISLRRVRGIGLAAIHPGHGPVVDAPDQLIDEYLMHRLEREEQILASIEVGSATVGAVVGDVYRDVDPALHPAAAISVAAHLRKLADEGRVVCHHDLAWDSPVALS